jgi:hypothetical protein
MHSLEDIAGLTRNCPHCKCRVPVPDESRPQPIETAEAVRPAGTFVEPWSRPAESFSTYRDDPIGPIGSVSGGGDCPFCSRQAPATRWVYLRVGTATPQSTFLGGTTIHHRWTNIRFDCCAACHRKVRALQSGYWTLMGVCFVPLLLVGGVGLIFGKRKAQDIVPGVVLAGAFLLLLVGLLGVWLIHVLRKRFVTRSSVSDIRAICGPLFGQSPAQVARLSVTPLATVPAAEKVITQAELAPFRALSAVLTASAAPADPLPPPTWWTAAVAPGTWPPGRWLAQLLICLVLAMLFGLGWLFGTASWLGPFFGVPMGVCFAGALSAVRVARRRRRYRFLAVLVVTGLVTALGMVLVPALGFWTQATLARWRDDNGTMEGLLGRIEHEHAGDFRFAPAAATARAGLRDLYADAFGKLEATPADTKTADAALRQAFREMLEDFVTRGDHFMQVRLIESIDLTPPPAARTELILWELDPAFNSHRIVNRGKPLPVADLEKSLSVDLRNQRAAQLAAALQKQLRALADESRFKLEPPGAKGARGNWLLECRASVRHSGKFVLNTTTQNGLPIYHELLIVPEMSWEIRVKDRDGQTRAAVTLVVPPSRSVAWNGPGSAWEGLGTYHRLLVIAYTEMAWHFTRRLGLDTGPAPTQFP